MRLDHNLIASNRVEGTRVYTPAGTHIGTIDHLMIDKKTGQVAYAVMSFGGVLGLGEKSHAGRQGRPCQGQAAPRRTTRSIRKPAR